MNKINYKISFLAVVLALTLAPQLFLAVNAVGSAPAPSPTVISPRDTAVKTQSITLPNPLGATKTIPELIGKIVDWLILISSIAVLPFMIIWGAYQLLMAGGNPDKVIEGRHTITWAVVGYGLLLLSKGIEFIIQDVLTGKF